MKSKEIDESIDSAFVRFNTIITSLKALDEGYSSKNYVRKFLTALHPKWRANVTAIEESKDLTSLSLDELIGNLKVHEMIFKKDSVIVKAKVKRKSLALKAKKESSDDECSTFGSEDEEYTMAIREFKKFFKRKECPNPPRDKNQRAFVGGSWRDSGKEDDKKIQDETCLVAQEPNEVCSESFYFNDEKSAIDDLALDNDCAYGVLESSGYAGSRIDHYAFLVLSWRTYVVSSLLDTAYSSNFQNSSNIFVLVLELRLFASSLQVTLELLHLST
nr:UBN2 domain-containing protein [Tanacetum cinerariifolium]